MATALDIVGDRWTILILCELDLPPYLVDDKDAKDGVIYGLDAGEVLTVIYTTTPLPAPEGVTIEPPNHCIRHSQLL